MISAKNFSGCVRYVVQKEGARVLETEGIRTYSVSAMTVDFNLQRGLNPDLGKAVGHISLSWSTRDREKLTPRIMAERAREYMEKMQIRHTQYLVVEHRDREHPHLHIVYNRIDYEGKTIPASFQSWRSLLVCREMNARHGYYLALGKGQVNRQHLKGVEKVRYELHDAVQEALVKVRSWPELEALLLTKDISVYMHRRGTEQVQGISFRLKKLRFKGSRVDRSLSYGNISKQLESNRQQNLQLAPVLQPRQGSHACPSPPAVAPPSGEENTLHSLADSLLAPAAALAEGAAYRSDYPHKKTIRRKKLGRHL